MSIRKEVAAFVSLGTLPDESADEAAIAAHQASLEKIARPVTDEEAGALLDSFGSDDCYGLAWTLLHLIESAPGARELTSEPGPDSNEWLRRLWARAQR